VAILKDQAEKDFDKYVNSDEHLKYLNMRRSSKSELGYTITYKEDIIKKAIKYSGYMVLISNVIDNAKKAVEIYRAKDVVEKGFLRLKKDLDLGQLRVHDQKRMENKTFVGFISLILLSSIHSQMTKTGLYKKMTLKELTVLLSKWRSVYINNERIIKPITKQQREVFELFEIDILSLQNNPGF
jgi:transposase